MNHDRDQPRVRVVDPAPARKVPVTNVQRRVMVGSAHAPAELEADRIADQVVKTIASGGPYLAGLSPAETRVRRSSSVGTLEPTAGGRRSGRIRRAEVGGPVIRRLMKKTPSGTAGMLGGWLGTWSQVEIDKKFDRLKSAHDSLGARLCSTANTSHFHLFEPPDHSGAPAHISRFFADNSPAESWFPLAGWGVRDPEVLFDWVAENRSALLSPARPDDLDEPAMIRVPVELDELISELAGLRSTGRAVLDVAEGLDLES